LFRYRYHRHENFLRDFFGDFSLAAHVQREAIDCTLMLPVKLHEGWFMPLRDQSKQVVVTIMGRGFQH
jgi:hypothetical protein